VRMVGPPDKAYNCLVHFYKRFAPKL